MGWIGCRVAAGIGHGIGTMRGAGRWLALAEIRAIFWLRSAFGIRVS